jgi:putative inorganic carbon (hco3(-)) transporter
MVVSMVTAAALAIAGGLASIAITQLAGTKTGTALALAAIGGPIFAYLAVVAPIVFPFGLFVVLVPFNNLLDINAFGTLTKILGIFAGFALLTFLLRTHRAVKPPTALFVWGGLVVWMAATAFWALDQQSVFTLFPTPVELVLLYAAISIFPSDRNAVRAAAIAAVLGGVTSAAYGAYLFHSGIDIAGHGTRLWILTDTSEIDPNHFAAALLVPIALCGAVALRTRRLLTTVASLGALAVLLIGVAESGSRGAVLGIAAIVVWLYLRGERRLKLIAFAVPAAVGLLVLSLRTSIWTRFAQALSTGGSNRIPIWKVGFTALKSHWLLGAGYNNFSFAYDEAFMRTNQAHFPDWHRAPHDLLLGTSVELGIVGLVLVLAGWYMQFRMMRDVPREDPDYAFRLAIEGALIGLFVSALFLDVMITKYVWLAFMLAALLRNAHVRVRRPFGVAGAWAGPPAVTATAPVRGAGGSVLP